MMKMSFAVLFLLCVFTIGFSKEPAGQIKWDMACQAYTFKEFSLSTALSSMKKLGINYVELYQGQRMTPDDSRTMNYNMPQDQMEELQEMLKENNLKATSFGVITPQGKEEWVKLFEFAKKMDIETIASEPKQDQLPMIDELCQKYQIRVALHNHPDPSIYWNPETVKKALEGRSEYMGACTDVGHWTRSGLDAVECFKILEGKVFELHLKDVNRADKEGHAVVLGEGIIQWEQVFSELKRQKFSGKFVIEHEYNWSNPVPDIEKNLSFFYKMTK